MARGDLIQQIRRYQSYIVSVKPPENDAPRILHYIQKLSKLPIKFEELEATGIGKTINGLRKRNGCIGEKAALLVAKWKSTVKKQVEEEEEEQSLKKEKSKKESEASNGVKRKFDGDDGQRKLAKNEENALKSEQKCDVKATHLITLKSRNKRKNSEQLDDEKSSKYAKTQAKERKESDPSRVQLKSNTVDVSLDKAESSHSDEIDPDFEKGKKERSHEDKKHKKGHEKRHKTSKHSHKSDRHDRHHSKSSHQEKKLVEENGDSSHKHHRSDSKSKSRSESKKEDRKHESSKKASSTNEKNKNVVAASVENHVDSTPCDDFGSALLNIPNTSPNKKRSTSSKASSYQDSIHSPSSQKSLTNFDMFSMKLEPLDLIDDIKDADKSPFYASPNANAQTRSTSYMQSEEDMLNSMIVTKNQKTKVYSGNKSSITNVPTLFELCARVLQDNFDALEYTGGVPYNILKTILEKVTALQLYNFENYNPYLIGETDDLWKYHAKKDFRKAERQEYESWRELYLRCFEEREQRLQALTKNISETIANSAPVRKTQLAYFDTTVKPPRNVARSQAKNGTGSSSFSKSSKQSPPTATQSLKERLTKDVMGPNAIQVPSKANSLVKKKKAPLMQKSLQLMKGLKR